MLWEGEIQRGRQVVACRPRYCLLLSLAHLEFNSFAIREFVSFAILAVASLCINL